MSDDLNDVTDSQKTVKLVWDYLDQFIKDRESVSSIRSPRMSDRDFDTSSVEIDLEDALGISSNRLMEVTANRCSGLFRHRIDILRELQQIKYGHTVLKKDFTEDQIRYIQNVLIEAVDGDEEEYGVKEPPIEENLDLGPYDIRHLKEAKRLLGVYIPYLQQLEEERDALRVKLETVLNKIVGARDVVDGFTKFIEMASEE